ncbi:MAG: GNAT family N-acetyltransferase [Gemmatimonadota bacterium]
MVGCVALRVHTATLGEVCAVAVSRECRGRGLGRTLVEAAVSEAAALGLRRVFALTRRPGFFRALGFGRVADDALSAVIGPEQAGRVRTAGVVVKAAMIRDAVASSYDGVATHERI